MGDNESQMPSQKLPEQFWLFILLWSTNKRKKSTDGEENNRNRIPELPLFLQKLITQPWHFAGKGHKANVIDFKYKLGQKVHVLFTLNRRKTLDLKLKFYLSLLSGIGRLLPLHLQLRLLLTGAIYNIVHNKLSTAQTT